MKSLQPKNLHFICFVYLFLLIAVSKASDEDEKKYYLSIWDPLSKPKPKETTTKSTYTKKPAITPPADDIISTSKSPTPELAPTPAPTAPTTAPTTTLTSIPTTTPTTTPSSADSDNNTSKSSDMIDSHNRTSNTSSVGVIIGIVIAVIVLVSICALAGFLWRRKRLRRFSRVTPMESWRILNDPSTDFQRSSRMPMPMTTNYSPSHPSRTFQSNQEFPRAKRLIYDRENTLPKIRRSNDAWEQYLSMFIRRDEFNYYNNNNNKNNNGYNSNNGYMYK